MIKILNLSKSFGAKQILHKISMTIEQGKTTCIIGKSGSGKSVLIKNIVGLLQPDEGSIIVDGKEIPNLTRKELFEVRNKMGFVFQGAALFDSLNVFENVVLRLFEQGERDFEYLEQEAKRVLSAVQLLPDIDEVPENVYLKEWNILKDKMPSELSGGMRKRVGLARALVGSPEYLFYDEPTTGLDPVTSEQIDDLILSVQKRTKVTSIVITHDLFSVYKIADKVAMLHEGDKVFDGNVDEFKSSKIPAIQEFQERYN
jgi:phospholipid/cholesterol/gamma-HCH transport system ATP-binding protein